jgi:hypothetical protein
MRFLIFASILLLLTSCRRELYKHREEITLSQSYTAASFRPHFYKVMYRAVIDGKIGIKKFHFSGLLYIKNQDAGGTRVVFQHEMGQTFFDFGWDQNDSFSVYSIMQQMNQTALIKTLKKDFELLLLKNIPSKPGEVLHFFKNHEEYYVSFPLEKGFGFYVTDRDRNLLRIENGDSKHRVISMKLSPASAHTLSDRIQIDHLNAGFTIDLKKITTDATE